MELNNVELLEWIGLVLSEKNHQLIEVTFQLLDLQALYLAILIQCRLNQTDIKCPGDGQASLKYLLPHIQPWVHHSWQFLQSI